MRLLLLVIALLPAGALAHVRWFVAPGDAELPAVPGFGFGEAAVQVWGLLAVALVAGSVWLDRRLPDLPPPGGSARRVLLHCLHLGTGLSLLLSARSEALLAPHFGRDGGFTEGLILLEAAAGLVLLFPPFVFAGAVLLALLYAGMLWHFGAPAVLEYLNVLGIAGFLAIVFHPDSAVRERLLPWSVPVLRIATGCALILLALQEKLLRPDLASEFVRSYDWNFMAHLGVQDFDDRLFVLSAGAMEAVFGVILILGTTTRLNILAVSGFMLTSNLTFVIQDHPREALVEIVGHLPIIVTALICVFHGAGQRLRVSTLLRRAAGGRGLIPLPCVAPDHSVRTPRLPRQDHAAAWVRR